MRERSSKVKTNSDVNEIAAGIVDVVIRADRPNVTAEEPCRCGIGASGGQEGRAS